MTRAEAIEKAAQNLVNTLGGIKIDLWVDDERITLVESTAIRPLLAALSLPPDAPKGTSCSPDSSSPASGAASRVAGDTRESTSSEQAAQATGATASVSPAEPTSSPTTPAAAAKPVFVTGVSVMPSSLKQPVASTGAETAKPTRSTADTVAGIDLSDEGLERWWAHNSPTSSVERLKCVRDAARAESANEIAYLKRKLAAVQAAIGGGK